MSEKPPELVLQAHIQHFVRSLGLLRGQAPVDKRISISAAHALMFIRTRGKDQQTLQADLLKSLNLDKSNITRLCMSLEKDGFVLQHQSKNDRRARQIFLTKKGERLADSLLNASQQRFSKILQQIPKNKHSLVFKSLNLLTNAILAVNKKDTNLQAN